MEKKIKYVLTHLSEEDVFKVYVSCTDLDCILDCETASRIKTDVFSRLGVVPCVQRRRRKISFTKIAVAMCIIVLSIFISVCAVNEPMRDKVIKIFNGYPEDVIGEGNRDFEIVEYTPIKYAVEQTVDFSEFDLSSVDNIIVTSGKTGETKTFYEVDEILTEINKLKGHSPISSRGYSGFSYNVKLCKGDEELCAFGIFAVDGNHWIYYGVYEEFRNIKYKCMYKSDVSLEDIEGCLDGLFDWEK